MKHLLYFLILCSLFTVHCSLQAQTYYNLQHTWEQIDTAISTVLDSLPAQLASKLSSHLSHIEVEPNPGVPTLINLSVHDAPLSSDHGYIFAVDSTSVLRLQAHTTDGFDIDAYSVTIGHSEPDPDYTLTVSGPAIASRWDVAGSDFAEYFESSAPIPLGISVVFDERGLIRAAKEGELPFGITSAGAGFIGNSGRPSSPFLTNALGDTLTQDVEYVWVERSLSFPTRQTRLSLVPLQRVADPPKDAVIITRTEPIPNPDYGQPYISHRNNPAMILVGLVGQIPLRKGQPSHPNWFFIKSLDQDTDLWLVK